MNANMKKWTIGGLVVVTMILTALAGDRALARKESQYPSGCSGCATQLRSGSTVCELTSCNAGCQYVCHTEPVALPD